MDNAEKIVGLIKELSAAEGDAVMILSPDPDPGPRPPLAVECCGEWTKWEDWRFEGHTLEDCLGAAKLSREEGRRPPKPDGMVYMDIETSGLFGQLGRPATVHEILYAPETITVSPSTIVSHKSQGGAYKDAIFDVLPFDHPGFLGPGTIMRSPSPLMMPSPSQEHTTRTAELVRLVQADTPLSSPEVKAALYRMSDGMREHEQAWIDVVFEKNPETATVMIDEGHLIVAGKSYSITDTPISALSDVFINDQPIKTVVQRHDDGTATVDRTEVASGGVSQIGKTTIDWDGPQLEVRMSPSELARLSPGAPTTVTSTLTTYFVDKELYDTVVAGGIQLAQEMAKLCGILRWQDELKLDDETFDQAVTAFKGQAEIYMRDKDDIDVDDTACAENCLTWVLMPIRLAMARARLDQKEDPKP